MIGVIVTQSEFNLPPDYSCVHNILPRKYLKKRLQFTVDAISGMQSSFHNLQIVHRKDYQKYQVRIGHNGWSGVVFALLLLFPRPGIANTGPRWERRARAGLADCPAVSFRFVYLQYFNK